MDKLKILDASFLYAETANTPMNIAAVQHFELPPGREDGFFDELKAYIDARVHLIPFMTKRLKATPFGMDHPVWVQDDRFDIDYHLQRTRVPGPGTQSQLEQTVARLHETPLDRSRPLWQYWLIEGLESGHVAWYTKYHHACIDGMAGQAIIDILFADAPEIPAIPAPTTLEAEAAPGVVSLLWDATRNATAQPLRTARSLPSLARTAWSLGRRAFSRDEAGLGALGQRAPKTRFNVAVGPYRSFSFGSLPLSGLKAVGKPHGCKANDVFMAVCAGALARYLDERGELPARPLIAGAPVSQRVAEDKSMSNQVSMLLTSLETHIVDPVARMLAIRDSANVGKAVVADLAAAGGLDNLSVPGLPAAFQSVMSVADRLRLGDFLPMPLNVVISNVPGPRRPVFLNRARMLTHYPVSIPAHGTAMNITVQSYQDRMDFSITACLDALPDANRLRDAMYDSWAELQRAAGVDPVAALEPDPSATTEVASIRAA